MATNLSAVRGDHFEYSFTITGTGTFATATGATFTGGVSFTVREEAVDETVTTDTGVLAQGTVAGGEITFSGAVGTIQIPATTTTSWPAKRLVWDLQGVITGSPDKVYTIDSGTIAVSADVTRSA